MKKALFSKVAGSLLLSAGLIAAGAASAQTTLTFDSYGNAFFGASHGSGSSADEFLFDLSGSSWAIGTGAVGQTFINSALQANYEVLDVSFFKIENGIRQVLDTEFDNTTGLLFYPNTTLSAGSYGFIVSGVTRLTTGGGAYSGNLNVTLAPVPEPATYAMLGVGIGLLAFTARRKSNNKLG